MSSTWNANSILLPDGKTQTDFRGKWVNYLDTNVWRPIDTSLREEGANWVCRSGPFTAVLPKVSTGMVEFVSTNKWDIFSKTNITDKDFSLRFTPIGVNLVDGIVTQDESYQMTFPNAYPFGDLIYKIQSGRAPRFQKLIRFNSQPTGTDDINISFTMNTDSDQFNIADTTLEPKIKAQIEGLNQEISSELRKQNNDLIQISDKRFQINKLMKKPWARNGQQLVNSLISLTPNASDTKRGVGIKKAKIWDSAGNSQEINLKFDRSPSGTIVMTKIVPRSFLVNAVYPVYTDTTSTFYPDPDVEVTSVDGKVGRTGVNQTWANIIVGAGTTADDMGNLSLVQFAATATLNQFGNNYRSIILFDTSSIGTGKTVQSATLSTKTLSKSDTLIASPNINIYGSTPVANTSLSSDDYGQTQSVAFSTSIAYADVAATDSYNDFILNANGLANISITGISKFSGKNANYDVAASQPPWVLGEDTAISMYSADSAGTTNDPKLVVTYVVSVKPQAFFMMG